MTRATRRSIDGSLKDRSTTRSPDPCIDDVASVLRDARRILFITGAGLSADSGLPTYRGVGGLYANTTTDEGIPIEEALSGRMFRSDPAVSWRHMARIEAAFRNARPNRGHEVIAELETQAEVWVLTQNVDGFHRAAGSTNVIDIHGDFSRLYCPDCAWVAPARAVEREALPRCPNCRAVIRPNVVLFGEPLDPEKVLALEAAEADGFDVVFSVGTSSLFAYVVEPVLRAAQAGTPTVEINPGLTELSAFVRYRITTGAAEALHEIARRL